MALVPPADAAGRPIRDGAVIDQDRSSSAVELERVLDDALPLLQSIRPDQLAATLGALATALEGRGEQLGDDLVTRSTTTWPQLNRADADDRRGRPPAGHRARHLRRRAAGPAGAAARRHRHRRPRSATSARSWPASWPTRPTLADATRLFLDRHGDQLIQLGEVSRPVLELLAAYAPEYPCLLRGARRAAAARRGGVRAPAACASRSRSPGTTASTCPAATSRSTARATDRNAAACPTRPCRRPSVQVNDGYDDGGRARAARLPVGTPARPARPAPARDGLGRHRRGAACSGRWWRPRPACPPVEVPDIAVLLWGPLLRGAVVNARMTTVAMRPAASPAPLVKLLVFAVGHRAADRRCWRRRSARCRSGGTTYRARFTDVTGLLSATTCASPACGWAGSTGIGLVDNTMAEVCVHRRRRRSRWPPASGRRSATATWSASATSR